MKISLRPKVRGRTIAFLTIVPLLIATALIRVPCPVCDGTGYVSSTPGMENVEILSVESKVATVRRDACGLYLRYNYEVSLTLTNSGYQDATGWIKLVLIDFTEGQPLSTQYAVVDVPARSTREFYYQVSFPTGVEEFIKTEVKASVLPGEMPDDTCGGTGLVSLNTLPLVKTLEDDFKAVVEVEKPFAPPLYWYWVE